MTDGATNTGTVSDRWRNLPRRWQVLWTILAGALIINLLLGEVGSLYSSPNSTAIGPASSLDSAPPGTAALATLLMQRHYRVSQLTNSAAAGLPSKGTFFVLDPAGSLKAEVPAMKAFVQRGGTLVLGGRPAPGELQALIQKTAVPAWEPSTTGTATVVTRNSLDAGVDSVESGGTGSWSTGPANPLTVLLAGPDGALALVASGPALEQDAATAAPPKGTIVLLASDSALQNDGLAEADDAAFGIDLAGQTNAPVVFDEYVHGYGRSGTGLAGLPSHWKAALLLGTMAAVVWMLSAGRRYGPPQLKRRELMPARVAHVDALAELLASGPPTRALQGAAPIKDRARQLLRRILQAGPDATDAELFAIAANAEHPMVDRQLMLNLLAEPATPEELLRMSRLLADLERRVNPKGSEQMTGVAK